MPQDVQETQAALGDAPAPGPFTFAGPGSVIAGYRLDERIGAGGMGVVYRAHDLALRRSVAIKLIQPELAPAASVRDLFVRESLTIAGLEHPHVVPIYAAGEAAGRLYIVMRLIAGRSLREVIAAEGRLAPGRVARLARQLAAALGAAHRAGVVHRDVKPANVLLTGGADGEHAYLTDFGLSAAAGEGLGAGGRAGGGTPAYCPPEQAAGAAPDPRADIYSLSCVLFEALTGRPPFVGDREGVVRAHRQAPAPAPSSLAGALPAGLDAALARGLAKDPRERFATIGELAAAVSAARHDVVLARLRGDAVSLGRLTAGLAREGLHAHVHDVAAAGGAGADPVVDVAASCALVVGRRGAGGWAAPIAAEAERRGLPLVVLLADGGPAPNDPALGRLADLPWIDLRAAELGAPAAARAVRRALAGGRPARDEDGPQPCPYPGLAGFGEDDALYFVGRDGDIEAVLAMLRTGRFVAVIGASGSGKSSLVRAGVIPRLRHEAGRGRRIARITPGAEPSAALAGGLARLAGGAGGGLLVVDQFEEVFTLCSEPAQRTAFLDAIADLALDPGGETCVLITLRADFYPRCAEHPRLRELIAARQRLLGPLGGADLLRAIEEPATRAGLDLEPGLSGLIIEDAGDDAAALPLISDLLAELWRRRSRRTLTLAAYGESGGVRQALAARADEIHAGLTGAQREMARRILLRLVLPGDGTADARRRVGREDLHLAAADRAEVDRIVDALVAARLLTAAHDPASGAATVEIAHEALIQGWPRLRAWIDADRDRLRVASGLADAAREWDRSGRDPDLLARGGRLALWSEVDRADLSAGERAFVDRSAERSDHDRRQARRRVRATIGGLTAVVMVVGAVAAFALVSRAEAQRERDLKESQRLVERAEEQLAVDPLIALLLSREAARVGSTDRADLIARRALLESRLRASTQTGTGPLNAIAFTAGGRAVAGSGPAGVVRWAIGASGGLERLAGGRGADSLIATAGGDIYGAVGARVVRWGPGHARPRPAFALPAGETADVLGRSPGGRVLVAGGEAGRLCTWSLAGGALRCAAGRVQPVREIAVGSGGRVMARDESGQLVLWRPGAPLRRLRGLDPAAGPIWAGGRFLFVDGAGALRSWRDRLERVPVPRAVSGRVTALAADRSGGLLALAVAEGSGGVIEVVRAPGATGPGGRHVATLRRHASPIAVLAFDESGERIVSGDERGRASVWEIGGALPHRIVRPVVAPVALTIGAGGASSAVSGIHPGFVPDPSCGPGAPEISAGVDQAGRLRALAGRRPGATGAAVVRVGEGGVLTSVAGLGSCVIDLDAGADGALVAGLADGRLWRWDGVGGARAESASEVGIYRVRLSPGGRYAATVDAGGRLRLWRADSLRPVELPETLAASASIADIAFLPDESAIITIDASQQMTIADLRSGATRSFPVPGRPTGTLVALAPSPDGRWVAIGSPGRLGIYHLASGEPLADGLPLDSSLWDLRFHGDWVLALTREGERGVAVIQSWRCIACGDARATRALIERRSVRPLRPRERTRFQLAPPEAPAPALS